MSELPNAQEQNPACGVCGSETEDNPDGPFRCEDCGLAFDRDTLTASFLDPDAKPCGAPCDNFWHGDNKIRPGVGYDCSTCKLPAGHANMLHWTGCESKALT